ISATGDLNITADLNIKGAGTSKTIIQGQGNVWNDRIIDIVSGTTKISKLTIQFGVIHPGGGGGIFVEAPAKLTVTKCLFNMNYSDGGGAINNLGQVTITASSFNGNSSNNAGGAILNQGTMYIGNSTFYKNSSTSYGGAIHNNLTLLLTNST